MALRFKFQQMETAYYGTGFSVSSARGHTDEEADSVVAWLREQTREPMNDAQITWKMYGHHRPDGLGNEFHIEFDNCDDRVALFKLAFGGSL